MESLRKEWVVMLSKLILRWYNRRGLRVVMGKERMGSASGEVAFDC